MRVAFDKPVVIIKDDKTDYLFDISPINHLQYPRDLRFKKIVEFKKLLINDVDKAISFKDKGNSYLSNFGKFDITDMENIQQLSASEYIVNELRVIKKILTGNERKTYRNNVRYISDKICHEKLFHYMNNYIEKFTPDLSNDDEVRKLYRHMINRGYFSSDEDRIFYDFLNEIIMKRQDDSVNYR